MAMFPVQCPFCGTVETKSENTSYICKNPKCKARLKTGKGGTLASANPKP